MEPYWINQLIFSFICPMSFDKFPLDQQTCKFRVGSYSYDSSKMVFIVKPKETKNYKSNSIALDYEISKRLVFSSNWLELSANQVWSFSQTRQIVIVENKENLSLLRHKLSDYLFILCCSAVVVSCGNFIITLFPFWPHQPQPSNEFPRNWGNWQGRPFPPAAVIPQIELWSDLIRYKI